MRKHLKQVILIASIMMLSAASIFAADMAIQANQLPKKAQDFVKANFANDQIVYAEQDRQSYKVELASGVEIDFDKAGDWTDVSGNNKPLPTNFIPAAIMKTVEGKYPQVPVLEISKEYLSYKLKLGNNREVYVDNNGKIVGDKLD
ncbi:PepSY-like domain-containing protein [Brachyspira hyodysenteriae]|uniref:Putative beta-lactamase-inhibitor-like PepSY-like domain-containing protein n=2 Tax=Brachyspira hyodysenteriae TaxID=159 RepID=A0A3B6W3H6_BRAHO|nr:PepSY-like domain-containing protein [Brachyspira hyodysenteriae]ANN63063.1 hypothetical protein BHYOB78_04050 [Brachyspira hyodysenteriae ATCC 27164]AUJ50614.1 periplasmic protein [Brachyspira hyodysenteriae]KLI15952.1 periplasmic protein [Brachyspira hyodysenteriae]KLI16861.1 periplasmic protein [Brachyspira hyodysenteriae]KLI20699.1 periplasmic protein [Brachyspira hyodysenteriae]